MNQIPITVQAQTTTVGVAPANFNQLLQLVASNLIAFISANVSFFFQGTVIPGSFVSSLFYNISNNLFYGWDTGTGKYQPITPFTQGDLKYTFFAGDNLNNGWVQCNGRSVNAVTGVSASQLAVLQSLFGASGSLPTITPIQSLVNLPGTGSFSGILNPAVNPPSGQFAGLTVNSPPQQSDVQATNQNAESLDESVISLQEAMASVLTQSEAVLDSLSGSSTAPLYADCYIGVP